MQKRQVSRGLALAAARHPYLTLRGCELCVLAAVLAGALGVACQNKNVEESTPGVSVLAAAAASMAPAASATTDAGVDHATHDCTLHREPRPPLPPSASATSLARSALPHIDKIRVSAHVGSVLLRKEKGTWRVAGKRGCEPAATRVQRALDNLIALHGTKDATKIAVGTQFELQIDVLMGHTQALHFEVARRMGDRDVVRLLNDEVAMVQGLDRGLWTPDPAAWCETAPRSAP